MKVLLQLLAALVLAAVQAALLHQIGGGTFSISLVLPCVVYLGLRAPIIQGAAAACAIGYVLDILAGGPKGLLAFLSVLLCLFSRLVGASFDIRWRGGFAALSGAGTLMVGFGSWILMRYVSAPEAAPGVGLLGRVLVEALLTGAVAPLVGWLMQRLDRLLEREEPGLLK
jgi:hypothetical protein